MEHNEQWLIQLKLIGSLFAVDTFLLVKINRNIGYSVIS
ncbi:hypothetical protein PLUTE_b0138 [Pseudoalteromonas luteoviolacea DSM 6061]|nr:hypothetical protein [Pseudoalteromonas luteoviolacea DSM 6061]